MLQSRLAWMAGGPGLKAANECRVLGEYLTGGRASAPTLEPVVYHLPSH